jgi:phospholipase/lecithinase/hemolysin
MKQTYRFARYLACAGLIAGTLSLWGCGSASTYDPITPTRIVAFGDALVDVGQEGRLNAAATKYRFTVNQVETATTFNVGTTFIEAVASKFGFGTVSYALDNLTAGRLPSTGAYSYGEFGALVSGAAVFGVGTSEPANGTLQVADARGCQKKAGNKAARQVVVAPENIDERFCAYSLQAQIDLFLAQGSPSSNDLFVISIGSGDIMATGVRNLTIDATTPLTLAAGLDVVKAKLAADGVNTQMQAAANALAVQIKRLTDAGAKNVLVMGPPNVGRSPWAATTGNATLFQNLSYNTGSGVISMGSEGLARIQATFGNKTNNPVLFVETSGLVNTLTDPTNASFANKTTSVCAATAATLTTVTAKSIGTGVAVPGQLTAALCTTDTLGGADRSTYVYADGVNFTTAMQSQFYNQALVRMRLAAWIN